MYDFVTGPLTWISVGIFIVGMTWKIIGLVRLANKKDKVVFNHFSWKWSFVSIAHWLFPFGSRSMREKPVFTLMTFAFHICLLATPIFLMAHNMLLKERWGVGWWTLPEGTADYMTIILIVVVAFLALRRIALPDVRLITSAYDFLLLGIAVAPFITGYAASHNWFSYKTMLILHILFGQVFIASIPFTKLSHMFLFFLTRAHIASEMGARRDAPTW